MFILIDLSIIVHGLVILVGLGRSTCLASRVLNMHLEAFEQSSPATNCAEAGAQGIADKMGLPEGARDRGHIEKNLSHAGINLVVITSDGLESTESLVLRREIFVCILDKELVPVEVEHVLFLDTLRHHDLKSVAAGFRIEVVWIIVSTFGEFSKSI